jgi:ribosomal protein S18 acetylase RimI-like enzyme
VVTARNIFGVLQITSSTARTPRERSAIRIVTWAAATINQDMIRFVRENRLLTTSMTTEFTRAVLPDELKRLVSFDHRVFPKADWFTKSDWERYESYWMIVNGVTVGCCGFEHNVDFREDQKIENPPLQGSLYISTTGILPRFRGKGFGPLLKAWEIAYARHNEFSRIVTNHRASNRQMIELNRKFGFRIIRRRKAIYYEGPEEPTVVMELKVP